MKKSIKLFLPFILLGIFGCAGTDINKILQGVGQGALSEQDVSNGLKEALLQGIGKGADNASREDGFFRNDLIRIMLPEDVRRVENTLRQIGLGSEVDRVLLTINRGAESAAREAKPIFMSAIRQLTIQDAWNILRGEQDAATQFLRRTTSDELVTLFRPKVEESLNQVGATRNYSDLVNKYNAFPTTTRKIDPDLNSYVTNMAIDGLFKLIAEEEKSIRENPLERSSNLMRRVFAAQD